VDAAGVDPPPSTSAAAVRHYEELASKLNKVVDTQRVSQVTHSYSLRWEQYKVTQFAELYYSYADGAISVKHLKSEETQIVNLQA